MTAILIIQISGLKQLRTTLPIIITDVKNECSCKLGITIRVKNGGALESGVEGQYLLVKHYNYNNKPVYYNSGTNIHKELHLYFGNITSIPGNEKGWIVQHEVGFMNDSPKLFHTTNDESTCPENVGTNWQTKRQKGLPDLEVVCL